MKILTLKKLLITEVSGRLSCHYLPKFHQKEKILTSLMMVNHIDKELCKTFNQFFSDVALILNIPKLFQWHMKTLIL